MSRRAISDAGSTPAASTSLRQGFGWHAQQSTKAAHRSHRAKEAQHRARHANSREAASVLSLHSADSDILCQWTRRGVAIPGPCGEGPKVFRWRGRDWRIADACNGFAVFHSNACQHRQPQPAPLLTSRTQDNHAAILVSGDRAFVFYFTHQHGADAEDPPAKYQQRTVIQVAALEEKNGVLSRGRDKPVFVHLQPRSAA